MGAKGDVKTSKASEGIQVLTGLGLIEEIVAINPTNEQKAKIFGYDLDESREEVEYTGENDNGKEKLSLDVYFNVRGEFSTRKHRFFLENEPIIIEKEGESDKFKWINQTGQTSAAESKEDLAEWFTEFSKWDDDEKKYVPTGENKAFRKCLKGEDQLMRFLREALSLNYELPSANLEYNYKKLFAGNVKELLTDLKGELFRKFVVMIQVVTKEKDGEESHFEKLWLPNNNFAVPTLPEDSIKHINNGCRFPTGWLGKRWKKYVDTHKNYPPTGFAPLEPIKVYDSAEDISAGKEAKKPEKSVKAEATADSDDY